jgi:hypothetical protein
MQGPGGARRPGARLGSVFELTEAVASSRMRRLRRDTGKEACVMELFTLIVWIMVGVRFEEVQILNLGQEECAERLMVIWGDRSPNDKGRCIGPRG